MAMDAIGVKGEAEAGDRAQRAIGVWATASGGVTDAYAFWSEGDQFSTTNNFWTTSDQNLKTNIQNLEGGLQVITQLQPKSYNYNPEVASVLKLPNTIQYGLVAQELEEVMPELVRTVNRSAEVDSLGNEVVGAMQFKAVNYNGLLPFMIAAIKEQQSTIQNQEAQIAALTEQAAAHGGATEEMQQLRERMDQLEELLAACCQNPATPRSETAEPSGDLDENGRVLRIQPNPFTEQTTIYYQLERDGRMQLMANSSDGKQLRVLEEAQRERGSYQFEWITNDLVPGIYYVTLLLDGEPVVKKAVKVK